MDAIRVENLVKTFDDLTAVDAVSLRRPRGRAVRPARPQRGREDDHHQHALDPAPADLGTGRGRPASTCRATATTSARSIGIVFQEPALDGKLTGRENLEFHAMMYGIGRDERRRRIAEVLGLVELVDKADILVEKYSGGMKRRLEIARGLIHRPKVLFLDEPTLGLDAQTRRHIWEYVRKLNKDSGVTIILTTHYMEEADFLCDRIAIMDHGKFVALDTPARLKDILGGDVVSLEMEGDPASFLAALAGLDWIKRSKLHDGVVSLTMERAETAHPRAGDHGRPAWASRSTASTSASPAWRTSSSISPAGRSGSRRPARPRGTGA